MNFKLIKPSHYYIEFKELLKFTITPTYHSKEIYTIGQKIQGTWTMFVVKMVLAVIVGVAIGLIYDPENKTTSSMMERFSIPTWLFVSVLALPLLEEIAFRLSLKFKPLYLALSLGVFGYYIASKAIYLTKLSDIDTHFKERITMSLLIAMSVYLLSSFPVVKNKLLVIWENHFRWILYVTCLVFAWVHILNYEITLEHLLLMPMITFPKLVNALCYGYVRINYGFIYSFAIHMFTNGIGVLVKVLVNPN